MIETETATLKVREAADRLHVKPATIRLWIRAGKIQTCVGSDRLIPASEIQRFARAKESE